MSSHVRDIDQQFWSNETVPHVTIRKTTDSIQGYKAHSHDELSIGLIESGATCLTIEQRKMILNKGDAILIAPDIVHACNPVNDLPRSYYMLYVDKFWCCEILSRLFSQDVKQFDCEVELLKAPGFAKALSALCHSLTEQQSEQAIAQLDHLLFTIVSHHCSPSTEFNQKNRLAYRVKARLLEDIVSPPSIQKIAKELATPTESLIRIFKRQFGTTPKSFLNNHRVEKAKQLLKSGMNIVDVASEVGYSDQSQFHKAFVNYTASTPRQYSVNFRQ